MAKTKYLICKEGRECSKCGEYKLWSQYNKSSYQKTGYGYICKSCVKVIAKGYQPEWSKRKAKERIAYVKAYKGKMPSGVYRIKTTIGDYIGESKHMKFRIAQHLLPSNTNTLVTREVFKEWEVLEYIEDPVLRLERELYYIGKYKPKLNTLGVK